MGRDRIYGSDAERQAAYRARKKAEEGRRGPSSAKRRQLSTRWLQTMAKALGMLGSDKKEERDNTAVIVSKLVKDAGVSWFDVLDVVDPADEKLAKYKPDPGRKRWPKW